MASRAALSSLPKVDIIFPIGNGVAAVESFKICANLVATLQIEASPDAEYALTGLGNSPYDTADWTITIADSGTTFTCVFLGEQVSQQDAVGRAALSTRRPIDILRVSGSSFNFTIRSLLALINWIDLIEDRVAQTGSGATGDDTYTAIPMNGNTPFNTYVWDVTKLADLYTIVSTATS